MHRSVAGMNREGGAPGVQLAPNCVARVVRAVELVEGQGQAAIDFAVGRRYIKVRREILWQTNGDASIGAVERRVCLESAAAGEFESERSVAGADVQAVEL